ncbi:hypothetical protein NL676_034663 [Syzygium grande]|nr:hypothetical protein NL676_034663 [Syzygium grande]
MSCLALSLQPVNGSDILLQTREWFPPARALVALSAFRHTRFSYAKPSSSAAAAAASAAAADPDPPPPPNPSATTPSPPPAASIYVLGITTADQDNAVNVFECIHIVNQAVSVVVAACRGVDVTPEKLGRKYAEIYMALDIVLRGVSSIRLSAMLSSMHGDGIAKMVHSGIDTESKIRGADSWAGVEVQSAEHLAGVEVFSGTRFEVPPETLAAGDEVVATIAPVAQAEQSDTQDTKVGERFQKNRDPSATDLTVALAGLEVPTLPPAEATQSTHIGVEGFEGDYGGIEFGHEQASLGETFEGFSDAWGGGLDPSEFVGTAKAPKPQGLGGLESLQTGGDGDAAKAAVGKAAEGTPLENLLVKKTEMKAPEMYISEEISAEFRESLLARVGLMGVVYLRTISPKTAGDKETEFSFRVDGTSAVKRFVMQSSRVSSLGSGLFHVRTAPSDEPIPILKYSLLPRLTPLPLRVRLTKRHSGTLLSVMIQYASNPEVPAPLHDVTFILKLPVDPSLLKVSPKAMLNRSERELKWLVPEIPLNGAPGKLRARMPVDTSAEEGDEEIEVVGYVKFSSQHTSSLSGVCLRPASEGKTDFYEVNHKYESGIYTCN